MKNPKIIILFVIFIFSSCMKAQFIRTGEVYPPLSPSDEIQVFLPEDAQVKYSEIGILRIMGGTQEKRIVKAKDTARANGGNAVITREIGESGSEENAGKGEGFETPKRPISYETQEFIIGKLLEKLSDKPDLAAQPVEETQQVEPSTQFFEEDLAKKPDMTQESYRLLPRATYTQLIKEYDSLKGEMFRGMLFPKKIFKVPASVKTMAKEGDKVVLLTSKKGKNSIYILVPSEALKNFKTKIKAKKSIDFVYSPVGAIRTKGKKRPVVKYIDEVISAEPGK